eukprot:scaffold51501_cov91-Phaeocystis_antarctica.AAC.2
MSGEVWKARSPTIEQHKAEVMSCGILKRLQQSMPAGAEPTAARRCICRDAYYAFSAVIARLMQALHGGERRRMTPDKLIPDLGGQTTSIQGCASWWSRSTREDCLDNTFLGDRP